MVIEIFKTSTKTYNNRITTIFLSRQHDRSNYEMNERVNDRKNDYEFHIRVESVDFVSSHLMNYSSDTSGESLI